MRVFAENFWRSAEWTPRNEALMEAVVKQARLQGHPWFAACDANVDQETACTCSLRRQEKELPLADPQAQMAS